MISDFINSLINTSQRHASQAALQCDGLTLTYGELFDRAQRLACELETCGVKPGDRLALWGRRGITDYVHVLGIWMTGAAYVPLGTLYGPTRNASILSAARVAGVLFAPDTELEAEAIAQALRQMPGKPHLSLDWSLRYNTQAGSWFAPCRHDSLAVTDDDLDVPSDLAYLLFTSGSTGTPKGVPIGFDSLKAYLEGMQSLYPIDASDRVSQMAQLSFDASVHEIFWTWSQGACLCVIPDRGILMWPRYVQDQQITSMLLVPSSVHLAAKAGVLQRSPMPSLRSVFLGAEAVTHQVVGQLHAVAPQAVFVNLWGPTESTVAFTHHRINVQNTLQAAIPIGKPLPGQRVMLDTGLDDSHSSQNNDADADADAVGEILQIGTQVMQGYWQETTLNTERFVTLNGERWFKSGDLARWDPLHGYWFMGRKDRQVKFKGYRIELDAVESVVRAVLQQTEIAVILSRHLEASEPEQLVCFMSRTSPPTSDELAQMASQSAAYMVPSVFRLIDAIPLSPSGKTDYKALEKLLP